MIKITKRKFIEMLENNESVMLGVAHREVEENKINDIMLDTNYAEIVSKSERRKVVKATPHRLTFSNASNLDIDNHGEDVQKECFLYSNNNRSIVAIVTTSKWCDDEVIKTVIYYLIVK